MAALATEFIREQSPSNVIQTSGSALYVLSLTADAQEPSVTTLTVEAAPTSAIGDETLNISADAAVTLRVGSVLTFASGSATVAADTDVTASTPTAVPVEPLEAAISAGDTAEVYGLLRILSPTALPLTSDSTNVDRKDYTYGLQGSEVKTRVNLNSSIQIIGQRGDRAYWEVVHPAGLGSNNIFAAIVTNAEHVFGAAQVSSLTDENAQDEISRPSFDLMFQAPFTRAGIYEYLLPNEQVALNTFRRRAGLSVLS